MVLELLSWLIDRSLPAEERDDSFEETATELADRASGDAVTPDSLTTADRTARPLLEYVEDDEQPEYLFRGGDLLISDESGDLAREHPSRELQVVVSDRRVLFVMGGRLSDDLWEVPLEDVLDAYLDVESFRRYLIVEAERDGAPMTFFADVTLTANVEEVRDGIAFVGDRT